MDLTEPVALSSVASPEPGRAHRYLEPSRAPFFLPSAAAITSLHFHSVCTSTLKIISTLKEVSVKMAAWQKRREPGALVEEASLCGWIIVTMAGPGALSLLRLPSLTPHVPVFPSSGRNAGDGGQALMKASAGSPGSADMVHG